MSVPLKSPEDIAKMRVAGRLAAELLDFLEPHVAAGHHHRRARPHRARPPGQRPARRARHAQLRAARTSPVSGFDLHVGQSRRLPRDSRRQEAEGRRHRQRRRHRDQGWLARRYEPHVLSRHAVDPGEAAGGSDLRGDVARHPRREAGREARRHRPHDPGVRRRPSFFDRARVLRPRDRPAIPRGAAGRPLRPARHRAPARCRG